jgi:hypothetical protein
LKYVNAPNFEKFRQIWNAKYIGGFVVHNKVFEGLTGNFPIGFLIWDVDINSPDKTQFTEIEVEVYDKKVNPIGQKKFYNLPNNSFLNVWLDRPKANKHPVIPLKNAVSPVVTIPRVKTWSDNALAYMYCGVNDLQHAEQQTVIYSSVYGGGNGFYINALNLAQAAIIFSVRRLIKPTWLNDRDQFLQATSLLTETFENDCLVWMLFNRCNRTASANNLEWDGRQWSITNHFIPYSENEVNASGRFESDFMYRYLSSKTFSEESKNLLEAGKILWRSYFTSVDEHSIRDEFKLNRPDVGWFQVRKALQHRNESGNYAPIDFSSFENAYEVLTEKLRPLVYELGFLKT